jgi:hypothetical protein
MKKCLTIIALIASLGGFLLLGPSWGQAPDTQAGPNNATVPAGRAVFVQAGPGAYPHAAVSAAQSEIHKLTRQLRDTEDEAKKPDLTKKLEAAVAKHFDEDMKVRETELTKLEERLKKLRGQLERRTKAKAEIIQLQLKVLINEAEGLGFSGASSLDQGGLRYGVPASALPPRPIEPARHP